MEKVSASGAERQRRYRERHGSGVRVDITPVLSDIDAIGERLGLSNRTETVRTLLRQRAGDLEALFEELSRKDWGAHGDPRHERYGDVVNRLLRSAAPSEVLRIVRGWDDDDALDLHVAASSVVSGHISEVAGFEHASRIEGYDFERFVDLIEEHRRALESLDEAQFLAAENG